MISRIELENFQGFRGVRNSTLAPITLVLGQNAVGKSSLFRSLKLFAQSSANEINYDGSQIKLLDFRRTIFGQDPGIGNRLSIEVETPILGVDLADLKQKAQVLYAEHLEDDKGHAPFAIQDNFESREAFSGFGFSSQQEEYLKANLKLKTYLCDIMAQNDRVSKSNACSFIFSGNESFEVTFEFIRDVETSNFGVGGTYVRVGLSTGNLGDGPDEESAKICKFNLEQIWTEFKGMTDSPQPQDCDDLNPELRDALVAATPEGSMHQDLLSAWWNFLDDDLLMTRNGILISIDPEAAHEVFNRNDRKSFIASLLVLAHSAQGRLRSGVRSIYSQRSKFLLDGAGEGLVSSWLQQLTQGRYSYMKSEIRSNSITGQNTSTEIFIHDAFSEARVSFENVGAGIVHLIPLLESVAVSLGSENIALIEEPELHLHPSAQAELAEFFVDLVLNNQLRQIILETHSENMLLRVQRLVRTGKLSAADVALVIVQAEPAFEGYDQGNRGNMFFRLNLLETGELEHQLELSFAGIRLDELL